MRAQEDEQKSRRRIDGAVFEALETYESQFNACQDLMLPNEERNPCTPQTHHRFVGATPRTSQAHGITL